jgi:cyclohexanone monooxygenase
MDDATKTLDLSPDAIREKYRRERDKRLRGDGEEQYIEVSGVFAHFNEVDPYVAPGFSRAPQTSEVEVAIVGGGFSGMLAAVRLRELGVTDVRIIEAAGDFGGTWYWNRYPGAQCDIESYCYLPLLEELGYIPKEKYSYAKEIFEHSRRIGQAYGLYDLTLFQTRVTRLEWDAGLKRWHVRTGRGDDLKARFVIMAQGPASRPKLPGIPGIETFKGHAFHTSRWDYGYTGGDQEGDLHKLADKTVAIIGTGATAVQCIPHLGKHAKQLFVFQRTPTVIFGPRGNRPTDAAWPATLQTGWQKARRENFNHVLLGNPSDVDLVDDGWTAISRRIIAAAMAEPGTPKEIEQRIEVADFALMNEIRAGIETAITDPATAEALKPWYRAFCKRPTFHDEYFATFNRPNVTLVDVSASKGVERITPNGLMANGKEYAVDCIVYATGFEISSAWKRRIGMDIIGRGGRSLRDDWADGFKTLHGFTTEGFPNWFYMGISQNGLSPNMTSMFDDQARHIAYIIKETRTRGKTTVEPTLDAQMEWVATIRKLSMLNRAYEQSCTPGYYNNEGAARGGVNAEIYAPGINAFNDLLAAWRARGDMEGVVFDSHSG